MKSLIKSVKQNLARHHNNYKGWSTSRKIVVIESDDWGSICMPSSQTKQKLLRENYNIDRCPYASYDALASEEDLQRLFSVLADFRDRNGNHPVITANAVMANPDFERIRESGFMNYYYEKFTDTLKKYPEHGDSFNLWKKGMDSRLFYPQFHGREHVNVKVWMKLLQEKNSPFRSVFDQGVTWLGFDMDKMNEISIRASYDTHQMEEIEQQATMLNEGLNLFEDLFGYKSKSFIANNFIYHPDLNQTFYEGGVRYIQGMKYQKLPMAGKDEREMIRHFQGEKNDAGQYYLVRNCVFEPSQFPAGYDNTGECIKGISNAFFWRKPAIITAHRLNFIGYIEPENRERNLKQFRQLLDAILKKWPDVEFMTSVELGDLIAGPDG